MTRDHSGTEPLQARSPLRLRLVMSAVMLVLVVVAAVLLGVAASGETGGQRTGLVWATVICAGVGVVAAVDVVTVLRRIRRGDLG